VISDRLIQIDCSEGPPVSSSFAWREDAETRALILAFCGEEPDMHDPAYSPSEHTRRSMAAAERRRVAADRTSFVVKSLIVVIAGVILMGLASWALLRRLSLLCLLAGLLLVSGCTAQQVQDAETRVYQALVAADDGVTWAVGHEAEIKLALQKAASMDPENKTLQSAVSKATIAIDNGDLGAAQAFTRSARIVFSPAPVPGTPATGSFPSGQ
jgi:hypothetical protein